MIGNRRVNQDIYAGEGNRKRRRQNRSVLYTAHNLAPRLRQMALLVFNELSNKEIAFEMGLTTGSAHQYMYKLFRKLGVKSRVGVAVWWVKNGNSQDKTT